MKNIAIFASGTGSNAQKIIDHFRSIPKVRIALLLCNKSGAGVLDTAIKERIPFIIIEKERFFHTTDYIKLLQQTGIDLLVLAGFLWQIPPAMVQAFPNKIINIHPALLPKFGGKGMYGQRVHEAVLAAKEKESGITIHYVDELYDHGKIILQKTCPVEETDTPALLAKKVQILEHEWYPKTIEKLLT